MVPTVDLGVRTSGFLRNRNRRAQSSDKINVRLRHLAQKMSGKAGKTFDIPPLSFGVECVKRQRALTGPADTGQANQLVSGDDKIDVAQIMFASAF